MDTEALLLLLLLFALCAPFITKEVGGGALTTTKLTLTQLSRLPMCLLYFVSFGSSVFSYTHMYIQIILLFFLCSLFSYGEHNTKQQISLHRHWLVLALAAGPVLSATEKRTRNKTIC